MHTADCWWIKQKVFIDSNAQNATIIPMLLAIDKTILIKHVKNITPWPISLAISTLSHKISRSWIKPDEMMVCLIFIHEKNFHKVKIEIYYLTIGVITKCSSNCHILHKIIQPNIIKFKKNNNRRLVNNMHG